MAINSDDFDGSPRTTIANIVEYLGGIEDWKNHSNRKLEGLEKEIVSWPPDLFAICASLLRDSCSYLSVTDSWPPDKIVFERTTLYYSEDSNIKDVKARQQKSIFSIKKPEEPKVSTTIYAWRNLVKSVSQEWLKELDGKLNIDWQLPLSDQSLVFEKFQVPKLILSAWKTIHRRSEMMVRAIAPNDSQDASTKNISTALIFLASVADEVSEGVGIRTETTVNRNGVTRTKKKSYRNNIFEKLSILSEKQLVSTLCRRVNARKVIILPKMRTPQSSISIRSMSHHLAIIRGGEVKPLWIPIELHSTEHFEESLTLLLIPSPTHVRPCDFHAVTQSQAPDHYRKMAGTKRRFFRYQPTGSELSSAKIKKIYDKARTEIGNIDGVILPEMSIMESELSGLHSTIIPDDQSQGQSENAKFMIVGVVKTDASKPSYSENYANFRANLKETIPGRSPTLSFNQHKHHRWVLDGQQIKQYGLGGRLSISNDWVEHITIPPRQISLYMMNEKILITTLICEDLAQADPIGDVIRSVGPNLAICLLADGPQLNSRWSARHATGLADDPGCSVLTLTSVGMINMSKPISGEQPRIGVIGQWKDPTTGNQELVIPDGADALAISLSLITTNSYTLDGRPLDNTIVTPVLSGTRAIKL